MIERVIAWKIQLLSCGFCDRMFQSVTTPKSTLQHSWLSRSEKPFRLVFRTNRNFFLKLLLVISLEEQLQTFQHCNTSRIIEACLFKSTEKRIYVLVILAVFSRSCIIFWQFFVLLLPAAETKCAHIIDKALVLSTAFKTRQTVLKYKILGVMKSLMQTNNLLRQDLKFKIMNYRSFASLIRPL